METIADTIIQLLRAACIAHAIYAPAPITLVQAPDGAFELPREAR